MIYHEDHKSWKTLTTKIGVIWYNMIKLHYELQYETCSNWKVNDFDIDKKTFTWCVYVKQNSYTRLLQFYPNHKGLLAHMEIRTTLLGQNLTSPTTCEICLLVCLLDYLLDTLSLIWLKDIQVQIKITSSLNAVFSVN